MTYNTGNPIGSTDARDRSDNSENLDLAVNSLSQTFVDRLGVTRDTLEGIYQKSAYYRAGTFDAGYTLTNNRQTLAYGNVEYSWSGEFPKVVSVGSTPATSGGVGAGAWVDRTDLTLRLQLNSVDGDSHIGYATYAQIRSYAGDLKSIRCGGRSSLYSGDGAHGEFYRDELDTTSIDNDGTILIDAIGRRWKRKYSGDLSLKWFGAKCDGVADDTNSINNAILSKGENSYSVIKFPSGCTAKILGTVYLPSGVVIDLNGSIVNGSGTNNMFESGKWVDGVVVSNFEDAPEASLVVDSVIENGLIQNCSSAIRVNNFIAGCRVVNIRAYHVNQLLHEKRSFYCEFRNLQAWQPLDGTLLPCFHWDGAIQANGVSRCFAGGYTIGHAIQGPNDMAAFSTCGAESCTNGVYLSGSSSGLTFRDWYFENNGTAIKADPTNNYEHLVIDECFFNLNYVILDGSTIRSGKFGKNNKVITDVSHPGNFNMLGNAAGVSGFTIELEEITDSVNYTTPTIDTAARFFVGPNVRISRIVTLTDSSGVPYARDIEFPTLPVLAITGQQFGTVPVNTVPFCETYYSAGVLLVKTQIPYQDLAMFSYNIYVVDSTGGPYWLRGIVMGDTAFPLSTGQKTVSVVNGNGCAQLNVSTFAGKATYSGVVKLL